MDTISTDQLLFARDPPEFLHLKCPTCRNLLEDPHLISCCGQHLCGPCVQKLASSTCPLCGRDFEKIPDKHHQRTINSIAVLCINKEEGCEWAGELQGLRNHLYGESGCLFALLPCRYKCGEVMLRTEIAQHEGCDCPERPATCSYCGSYSSTWKDVHEKHSGECPEVTVTCPNSCGQIVVRRTLPAHLGSCPLQQVDCDFAYAGCKWRQGREAVDRHNQDQWQDHMYLVTSHNSKRIEDLTQQLSSLSDRLLALEEKRTSNRGGDASLDESSDGSSVRSSSPAPRPLAISLQNYSSSLQSGRPYYFQVTGFARMKEKNQSFASSTFYYGKPGYAFRAYVHPNGMKEGLNTHVSVFLHIIPSRKDSILSWPFQGCLTVRLRDQNRGHKHYEKVFDFKQAPSKFSQQPHGWASEGFGYNAFIPHRMLQPRYLHDDRLVFEVLEVILPAKRGRGYY